MYIDVFKVLGGGAVDITSHSLNLKHNAWTNWLFVKH